MKEIYIDSWKRESEFGKNNVLHTSVYAKLVRMIFIMCLYVYTAEMYTYVAHRLFGMF